MAQLRLLIKDTLMEVVREMPELSAAAHTDAATPASKFKSGSRSNSEQGWCPLTRERARWLGAKCPSGLPNYGDKQVRACGLALKKNKKLNSY